MMKRCLIQLKKGFLHEKDELHQKFIAAHSLSLDSGDFDDALGGAGIDVHDYEAAQPRCHDFGLCRGRGNFSNCADWVQELLARAIIDVMREYIPKDADVIPQQAELKFKGVLFDVYQWPQEMFDGSIETFEMLRREDTVEVIAIKDDKIVITYQTQPCQDWFYAYPGGRHDNPAETELDAAKRELREEAGMTFANWKLIEVHQPFTKIDWLVYTFIATDFKSQGDLILDAGEKIEVLEVTFDELKEYAKKPNAKFLMPDYMKHITSLEELKNMPSLHEYKK